MEISTCFKLFPLSKECCPYVLEASRWSSLNCWPHNFRGCRFWFRPKKKSALPGSSPSSPASIHRPLSSSPSLLEPLIVNSLTIHLQFFIRLSLLSSRWCLLEASLVLPGVLSLSKGRMQPFSERSPSHRKQFLSSTPTTQLIGNHARDNLPL